MKIAFIIPFKYKFNNFSNVKSHYECLLILGHDVDLYDLYENPDIYYSNYDQVWLMGSGAKLDYDTFMSIKIPVISFGWSDPNLFSIEHALNCDIYCTNDLTTYNNYSTSDKKCIYYQTSCDQRYHKNLNIKKTTDILVYGIGQHKFIGNRNIVVDKLRGKGFNIKVFGRGWNKHEDTHKFIEGQQFIEEINKAHIVLDITNETSAWGHRIFESSACGTPVLTYDREDTRQLLQPRTEVLLYKTFEDIIIILNQFLHTRELRQIGLNAQKRCYKDHDIGIRIKELLKTIEEIK